MTKETNNHALHNSRADIALRSLLGFSASLEEQSKTIDELTTYAIARLVSLAEMAQAIVKMAKYTVQEINDGKDINVDPGVIEHIEESGREIAQYICVVAQTIIEGVFDEIISIPDR